MIQLTNIYILNHSGFYANNELLRMGAGRGKNENKETN